MYIKMQKIIAVVLTTILLASPVAAAMPAAPTVPALPIVPEAVIATISSVGIPQLPTAPVAPEAVGPVRETTPKVDVDGTSSLEADGVSPAASSLDGSAQTTSALNGTNGSAEGQAGDLGNSTTGSSSNNQLQLGAGSDQTVGINNDANVTNNITGVADTGGDNASYNTGNGSVQSGDSSIVLTILNFINTTVVGLSPGGVVTFFSSIFGNLFGDYVVDPVSGEAYSLNGSRVDITNSDTGANSTNNALVNTGSDVSIGGSNNAILGNDINVTSNTGGNASSYNTGNGSVTTGDSNVSLNLLNFVNSSLVASNLGFFGVINIFGNWIGNLILPDSITGGINNLAIFLGNNQTGANSTNNASLTAENTTEITTNNSLNLDNNINIDSTTGDNDSSYNTGNGSVDTGQADARVNVANLGNETIVGDTVFLTIVNLMGKWNGVDIFQPIIILSKNLLGGFGGSGQVDIGNSNTGAGSTNDASATISNNTSIETNNLADIINSINISSNTGGNSSSYNTGSGSVVTGDSNVLVNLLNFANVNIVASRIVAMVINVFGDWTGQFSNEATADNGVVTQSTASSSGTSSSTVANTTTGDIDVSDLPTVQDFTASLIADGGSNPSQKNESIMFASNSDGGGGLVDGVATSTSLGDQFNIYWYILGVSVLAAFAVVVIRIRRRLQLQRFQGFGGGMKWN